MIEKPILFVDKSQLKNKQTPCTICGACCNYFKIEFDVKVNPQVPNKFYNVRSLLWRFLNLEWKKMGIMIGTEKFKHGRCSALDGEIGKKSLCSIYTCKPNHCGSFPVWMLDGKQNPRCIEAREWHGLPGLITEEELLRAKKFEETLS